MFCSGKWTDKPQNYPLQGWRYFGLLQEAAVLLAYGDYWDLALPQRVALLRGLCALALNNESVCDHFQSIAEAMDLPRRKARQFLPKIRRWKLGQPSV